MSGKLYEAEKEQQIEKIVAYCKRLKQHAAENGINLGKVKFIEKEVRA